MFFTDHEVAVLLWQYKKLIDLHRLRIPQDDRFSNFIHIHDGHLFAASSFHYTPENLKSHLQKFRIHRDRSKGEYASYYEMSTRQMEERAGAMSMMSSLVFAVYPAAVRLPSLPFAAMTCPFVPPNSLSRRSRWGMQRHGAGCLYRGRHVS